MKKLFVENFGPIKSAEIEIKSVNLLIGEQSIGKSTLAKLITIMTDYYNLSMIVQLGIQGWRSQLTLYGLDLYDDEISRVEYSFDEDDVVFQLKIHSGSVISSLKKDGKIITNKVAIFNELLHLRPIYHLDVFREQLKKARAKINKQEQGSDVLSLVFLLNNSLYIPAERSLYSMISKLQPALTLTKNAIPTPFLRFMLEMINAQSKYPQYDSTILNITYLNKDGDDFFIDYKSNKQYPLSVASSGIQSTIPLLLVLEYEVNNGEYSSIVIEEPETNLFPSTQVALLRFILEKVLDNNRTLTITTHSPYLLSAMNNYLFAGSIKNNVDETDVRIVDNIIPRPIQLGVEKCSVYSLGQGINSEGKYCVSLIDKKTGMIDLNCLDIISEKMAQEFGELEDAYLNATAIQH
jgi:predicted ATPase